MPEKIIELINKVKSFKELKPNWDSYGADPIPERVIDKTIDIIHKLWKYNVYFSYVFAGNNQDIQFEIDGKYNSADFLIKDDLTMELTTYGPDKDRDMCKIIEEKIIKDDKDLLIVRDMLNLIINDIKF